MRQRLALRSSRIPSISQRSYTGPSAVFSTRSRRTHTGPAAAATLDAPPQAASVRARSATTRRNARTGDRPGAVLNLLLFVTGTSLECRELAGPSHSDI